MITIFDSDGNPIDTVNLDTPDAAEAIGQVVLQHYALVDSEPHADEPFLTITREVPQYPAWSAAIIHDHRNGYHVTPNIACKLCRHCP